MGKTISILGCGWLGKPLATALLASGYKVKGSTTREENLTVLKQLGVDPFVVDLSTESPGRQAESFFECDVLIVSIPPRRKSGNEAEYLSQMDKTIALARSSRVSGVIFFSSTSVYRGCNGPVNEVDADPKALLSRAEQKFLTQKAFATTVLRFAGLVGPSRHPGNFLAGRTVTGAKDPVNLIHQSDCIAIVCKVLGSGIKNEVYNACSDRHPEKEEFYTAASKAIGAVAPVFVQPANDAQRVVVSEKLKQHFGYEFMFGDPMTMTF